MAQYPEVDPEYLTVFITACFCQTAHRTFFNGFWLAQNLIKNGTHTFERKTAHEPLLVDRVWRCKEQGGAWGRRLEVLLVLFPPPLTVCG